MAADGWTTTLAAMGAAAVLWGSGGLALVVGRPWELGVAEIPVPTEIPAPPAGVEVRQGLR